MDIKRLREITGLSQVQFAKKYGMQPNTVARWERGELNIPPYTLALLERVITELDYKEVAMDNMTFYEKQLANYTNPTLRMVINEDEVAGRGKTVNEFMVPLRHLVKKFGLKEVEPDLENHIYTFYAESNAEKAKLAQIAMYYDDAENFPCFKWMKWIVSGVEEDCLEVIERVFEL